LRPRGRSTARGSASGRLFASRFGPRRRSFALGLGRPLGSQRRSLLQTAILGRRSALQYQCRSRAGGQLLIAVVYVLRVALSNSPDEDDHKE